MVALGVLLVVVLWTVATGSAWLANLLGWAPPLYVVLGPAALALVSFVIRELFYHDDSSSNDSHQGQ